VAIRALITDDHGVVRQGLVSTGELGEESW
jgi:hypothetical protein